MNITITVSNAPTNNNTAHWTFDRIGRQSVIDRLGGDGNEIASIYWDKGHWNGAEIHTLTDNGIIIVTNARSGKVTCKKIARVGQLRQLVGKYDHLNHRYFEMRFVPRSVINKCRYHEINGYHNA